MELVTFIIGIILALFCVKCTRMAMQTEPEKRYKVAHGISVALLMFEIILTVVAVM